MKIVDLDSVRRGRALSDIPLDFSVDRLDAIQEQADEAAANRVLLVFVGVAAVIGAWAVWFS